MADHPISAPEQGTRRITEALDVLKALDFPRGQLNQRSALTLLALLDLKPPTGWTDASAPLMGITPIMDWCRSHYGITYAPNTRETFRRQTMHQFVAAALAIANPDQPDRPVNSPRWCYQIEPSALKLLQTYSTERWAATLETYRSQRTGLRQRYAKQRGMRMVPVTIADGMAIRLTPGKHSTLIKAIIEEFGPRYAPNGQVIYVGDTGDKWGYFDSDAFRKLSIAVDAHGKMPDVLIYAPERNWLLLIEAVTSHGPVDGKRHDELARLFSTAKAGLIYVTAFPSRREMARYIQEISWETEVWIADTPEHLIHFDGTRFFGPYERS